MSFEEKIDTLDLVINAIKQDSKLLNQVLQNMEDTAVLLKMILERKLAK